jgi:spore coat protein CotH
MRVVAISLVSALFVACNPRPGPTDPGAEAGPLFDATNPVVVELEVSDNDLATLRANPRDYVPAMLTVRLPDRDLDAIRVGLALKGNPSGSFRSLDEKAAFKINVDKFDPGQRLLGIEGMKLNNMVEDTSLVHEAMGYALFQQLEVPSPRAGIADVFLNGQSYGVHALIERIDDTWSDRFFDSTHHIYEGDFSLDVLPENVDTFEVDEGDANDRSDLRAFADIVSASDFHAALSDFVDVSATCRVWIVSQYIAHWDGYAGGTNNFYLHSDDDGRFAIIPSGLDQSLEDPAYQLWDGRSPFSEQGWLYSRCREDEACRATCDAEAIAVRNALQDLDALQLLDDVARAVTQLAERDPFVNIGDMRDAQNAARTFLQNRPAVLP